MSDYATATVEVSVRDLDTVLALAHDGEDATEEEAAAVDRLLTALREALR